MNLNMNEKLVSYKTAKLAKELGFDWKVLDHWTFSIENDTPYFNKGIEIYGEYINHNEPDIYDENQYFSAPTQAHLQKWLRDTFNCHVRIVEEFYVIGINFNVQVLFYDPTCGNSDLLTNKTTGLYGDNAEFPTYEKALEFGLRLALLRLLDKGEDEETKAWYSLAEITLECQKKALGEDIRKQVEPLLIKINDSYNYSTKERIEFVKQACEIYAPCKHKWKWINTNPYMED